MKIIAETENYALVQVTIESYFSDNKYILDVMESVRNAKDAEGNVIGLRPLHYEPRTKSFVCEKPTVVFEEEAPKEVPEEVVAED